ncbi:DNA polymerase III subunit epsilon [Alginatibacterium sediminis]|uniref:DNA polymerase III subunit epsilon n=1 Tax=Alginatibacterium sediminis TaxID=2164068 RepID=A0A420E9N7_9ALTE|nr:DNA polymerase III subunit epsilon [Alginatibacterium sediminis]RKF17375.1 DNA polymerase III subunit epsilon [Alginatibacterium sediminis]
MSDRDKHRLVIFDTETTGMNEGSGPVYIGHRVIEIGCVEVVDRKFTGNTFHVYVNPQQLVDEEAYQVHGISDEFLADKPLFASVAGDFIEFIRGAELVAHNANFDISFLDHEFSMMNSQDPIRCADICTITDSLLIARKGEYRGREVQQAGAKPLPGRKNLDALSDYYGVDRSSRTYHGALLDAELLADVFLKMTGGQNKLNLQLLQNSNFGLEPMPVDLKGGHLSVLVASDEEQAAHEERLALVEKKGGSCLWTS